MYSVAPQVEVVPAAREHQREAVESRPSNNAPLTGGRSLAIRPDISGQGIGAFVIERLTDGIALIVMSAAGKGE
jgi:hypothetical protein